MRAKLLNDKFPGDSRTMVRPVYKNVRFRDLIPGETYQVRFKAFTSEGDRFSTRHLQFQTRNSSAVSQIYYFLDVASGEVLKMYRRITAPLLELVNASEQMVLLWLQRTSRLQYTYRLSGGGTARGRGL